MSIFSVPQTPMKKTKALIGDAGATFVNAVSTISECIWQSFIAAQIKILHWKQYQENIVEYKV